MSWTFGEAQTLLSLEGSHMTQRFVVLAAAVLFASPRPASCAAEAARSPERDRRAILAMAGRYRVSFNFAETVGFQPGYALVEPHRSQGTELVLVADDTGDVIELQHILVLGADKTVVKHWRQRWQYECRELLEFRGNRTFVPRKLAAEDVPGTWTQSVFEVDDAPRYQGYGRWRHEDGVSSWESDETWRPLPRREYTRRSDYDVIVARNRHTLAAGGWVHEQDNLKVKLRTPSVAIAREAGLNRYDRIEDWDFSKGVAYWRDTEAFWRDVRRAWLDALGRGPSVVEDKGADGGPRYEALLALADEVRKAGRYDAGSARERISDVLSRFVHLPSSDSKVAERRESAP